MGRPTLGHLDPVFVEFMDELKCLLQFAFQTSNTFTMPISGPGSVGMEACFVNLVQPGDTVVVCINGVFGVRMKENVKRCGARAVIVEDAWGRAVDPKKVEAALKEHPEAEIVAFVHAETSTGARSDVETLVKLAHHYDCLTIVDTVTSLGGIEVAIDGWEVDAVYSESQKCLSCSPGLSPVSFGPRGRGHSRTPDSGPELVHGHQPGDGLMGQRPETLVSPHRADQRALRPPRGPRHPRGRRARECLGATHETPPRPLRGLRGHGSRSRRRGLGTASAAQRRPRSRRDRRGTGS
jgi:hypothetical protein